MSEPYTPPAAILAAITTYHSLSKTPGLLLFHDLNYQAHIPIPSCPLTESAALIHISHALDWYNDTMPFHARAQELKEVAEDRLGLRIAEGAGFFLDCRVPADPERRKILEEMRVKMKELRKVATEWSIAIKVFEAALVRIEN